MSMRKQFVNTIESTIQKDERLVVLLGDIGVFGFRNVFETHPDRIYNIGILEQATVGMAAGLAMTDFIPVVHTIAPFLIERSLEQLKIDFCYQNLGGNFVSVGGSYDYAALGCTHHCPGDVGILKNVPRMQIVLPGSALEFDSLFKQAYANGQPTYFRLSEYANQKFQNVDFGRAKVIKEGSLLTVIAIGPTLDMVLEGCKDLDVSVLYYTTVAPFDHQILRDYNPTSKFLVCEPYYSGAITFDIQKAVFPKPVMIDHIGVPCEFRSPYGSAHRHNEDLGLTPANIRKRAEKLIYE